MRISKRKTVISLVAVVMIFISGSFVTVNAATEGKLIEDIKDLITVTYNEEKYEKKDVKKGIDENGNEYIECELRSKDGTEEIVIMEMQVPEHKTTYNITEDGVLETTIESKSN